jgi:hypothetical protein
MHGAWEACRLARLLLWGNKGVEAMAFYSRIHGSVLLEFRVGLRFSPRWYDIYLAPLPLRCNPPPSHTHTCSTPSATFIRSM